MTPDGCVSIEKGLSCVSSTDKTCENHGLGNAFLDTSALLSNQMDTKANEL